MEGLLEILISLIWKKDETSRGICFSESCSSCLVTSNAVKSLSPEEQGSASETDTVIKLSGERSVDLIADLTKVVGRKNYKRKNK